ncbi:MAG TPA: protein kinase [Kofleriaceae bacterium]|nr:protein kinase [Kofleriaceae bacterium]
MAITPRSIDAGVGIGEIFLDKYRVDSILGHGGMGVVALCTHLALNERVAIKMLRKDVLDDADAVERFMREAQAAVKLKSEFVARVSDVGRSDTNVPYMVMEYLEGHDLGELLDERGSLALPWAVELTLQACEALAEAHSIGIVHRDVKPTNLFVTWRPDGSALIKVLDFGISKAPIVGAMQLTQTQSLLGTPAYMSPEQMRSARMVDSRTDLWSLGTVLYELLEGRRPFEAESFSEMCVKVAVDPPQPMVKTPPALQTVVLRCLEKSPDDRYASMAELARDLVPFSHDPHQAQVLVERMSRMLRRSAVIDWDPTTSGAIAIRDRISGRVTAETPPVPSAPVQAPVATMSPAALAERAIATKRPPTRSVTMAVTRPKRNRAVVIVALLSLATAIGVVISLVRSPAPAPRPVEPVDHMPALPTPPGPAKLAGSADQAPSEPPALPDKTPDKAADELIGKAPDKPPIHTTKPAVPHGGGDPKPPHEVAPTAEQCDPTANPHPPAACFAHPRN